MEEAEDATDEGAPEDQEGGKKEAEDASEEEAKEVGVAWQKNNELFAGGATHDAR